MREGWEIMKLGEVVTKASSNISQNQLANEKGDYPIYGASGFIKNIDFSHRDTDYISIVKDGAGIGRITLLKAYSSVIGTLQYLIPNKNIDIRFLYYFLSGVDFNKYKQGSTIPHIYFKDYAEAPILVPPLPEQKRIVTILDKALAAINKAKENAEKNLQNAREIIDISLQNTFANKNSGWPEVKLNEVAEYFNGLTYSPKDVSDKGTVVLRSSNVQNDELDFSDIVRVKINVKDKLIVRDGDILMCSRNGSKRLVGKTATIKNLKEAMTFGTFMMIIRSQDSAFLSWFFKSNTFRKQISGGENTMINQITRYMLDDISVCFPSSEVRQTIVQKLDSLSAQTKKLESIYQQKLNSLEELKKSILQKAFADELKTEAVKEFA